MKEPSFTTVRARDIKPHLWALWCSVEGYAKPFANDIEAIRWSEDKEHLWLLLGTHNAYKVRPDDELHLVKRERSTSVSDELWAKWNAWTLPAR